MFLKKIFTVIFFPILISRCFLLVESEAIDFCVVIFTVFTKLSYLFD